MLIQLPTCRVDNRETPAAKNADATAPQSAWRYMCLSNTKNLPCLRRNLNIYWHVLPIVTQKQRGDMGSIRLLTKRLPTV